MLLDGDGGFGADGHVNVAQVIVAPGGGFATGEEKDQKSGGVMCES